MQAEKIKTLMAAAASSAFATRPSAVSLGVSRPSRNQPPAKKPRAAVPAGPAMPTTKVAGTAPGRATSTPLVPGSLTHNATVSGDTLTFRFDARGTRPADSFVISIAALAAASGAKVADHCWACVYLKALMRNPSDPWPLAHCPSPLDPAHGAMGSGMHALPVGLTRPVALNFR